MPVTVIHSSCIRRAVVTAHIWVTGAMKGRFIKIGCYYGIIIVKGIWREGGKCALLFCLMIYSASWLASSDEHACFAVRSKGIAAGFIAMVIGPRRDLEYIINMYHQKRANHVDNRSISEHIHQTVKNAWRHRDICWFLNRWKGELGMFSLKL